MTWQVRIATWNVGGGEGHDQAVRDALVRLREDEKVRVLFLQEVADRKPQLPADGWGLWQPDGDAKDHCAITWKQGALFDVQKKDTVKIGDKDPSVTTGKGSVANKWLHRVALLHNDSNRVLQTMTLHMVASVNGNAANAEDKQKRRDAYRQAIGNTKKRVNELRDDGAVLLGGDWNTDWNDGLNDPLRQYLQLGHKDMNTHGDRAIDFILREQQQAGVSVVETKTLSLDPSDHKALIVTYELTHTQ